MAINQVNNNQGNVINIIGGRKLIELPEGFPIIVTLCGSTRFMNEYIEVQRRLTLEGHIVISVGLFGHQEGLSQDGEVKAKLDRLHFHKIELSDCIFVVNGLQAHCNECGFIEPYNNWPGECPKCYRPFKRKPYVGQSTQNEIEYAKSLNIPVQYLNPIE